MSKKRKPYGYWTKERCKEEALKYRTRYSFQKGSKSAYNKAYKEGWLDELYTHMDIIYGKWTKERCSVEALKYETRRSFQEGSRGAYIKSIRNGWLDDVCKHMIPQGSLKNRYLYSYEFPKSKCVYVGITWNINQRDWSHKNKYESSVYKHIKKNNFNEGDYLLKIHGYYDMKIAPIREKELLEKYVNNGWIKLNKTKCGSLGGNNILWIKERCKEEALKYETRKEFYKGSNGAYNRARINGWLDDMCKHMVRGGVKWTKERCKEEALKYETRVNFKRGSNGAYNRARINGWLDDICKHMVRHVNQFR